MKVIKLETELKPLLSKAKKVDIAVAIMTEYGYRLLKDSLPEDCEVNILIGIDLLTPIEVFETLHNQDNKLWTIKVFRRKAFFHPKFYFVSVGENKHAFIGSGNFTKGGVSDHVELFCHLKNEDAMYFVNWFDQYFKLGEILSEDFINEYRPYFEKTSESQFNVEQQIRKIKRDLLISSNPKSIDLGRINFDNQFFKHDHFDAFTGTKPYSHNENEVKQRLSVKNRLYELHNRLYPIIQVRKWEVHPHEMTDHIVSSHKHGEYTSDDLGALWLHYGRSPIELRKFKDLYGENQTSMYQMRMQVLIHSTDISVWLTVGKNNGAVVDRTSFKENMRKDKYRNDFFNLLKLLPDSFYISINNEERKVNSFDNDIKLMEFTKEDNIRNEYFIIGRNYPPDDVAISEENIVNTVINDFNLLYPIYLHIRTSI